MARKIQFKRGLEKDLPLLDVAEFGFTTDTERLFLGSHNENIEMVNKKHADQQIEEKIDERTANLKQQLDTIVVDGDSSIEAAQARVKSDGTTFTTLKERLDSSDAQLAEIKKQNSWMKESFTGTRLIAHRGYEAMFPENTLKAYFEAGKLGFFGWELDPYLTKDGVWINMHDHTVDRTTNGTGNVSDLTYEQIKSLVIDGGNNASLYRGLKVPSIEECFQLACQMEHKPVMFLNTRTATPIDSVNTLSLVNIIKKYNYENRTVLFTFPENFEGVRKEIPSIGVCSDYGSGTPTLEQIRALEAFGANTMISVYYSVLLGSNGQEIIDLCKDLGILLQAHSVYKIEDTQRLADKGINSLLVDQILSI